jgi:hypothetical protein
MNVPSTRARPGIRRVLSALGSLASELEAEKRNTAAAAQPDWRASLIAGQRNVIAHYRRVLATQRMPPVERQAVLDRIARIEDEIHSLQHPDGEHSRLEAA